MYIHHKLARRLAGFVSSGGGDDAFVALAESAHDLGSATYHLVAQPLPISKLSSEDDVERIANELELAEGLGPSNAKNEISGIFYELALNAVQHSQSVVGEYATLECVMGTSGDILYAVGVADCGIGIPQSLRKNPDVGNLERDDHAIALATELHVTGTGHPYRGIGLNHVTEVVKRFKGCLIIISGYGCLDIIQGREAELIELSPTDRLFGTVATVSISVPPTR